MMQCNEVKEHLHAYADGELEPSLHESVRDSLSDCADCQEELAEIVALQLLAREVFATPVEEVDFSGFADAVMSRIGEENAIEGVKVERTSEAPSLMTRLSAWFGELFALERPLAAFAALALVVDSRRRSTLLGRIHR
jgi:anti-sigma factor RsiW